MVSRLRRNLFGLSLLVLVTGLLTLCSLGVASPHTSASQRTLGSGEKISCGGSCHPHSQTLNTTNPSSQEEDDKEPIPPEPIWLQAPVNLSLLYAAPVFTLFIAFYMFRKHLLSVQLRF